MTDDVSGPRPGWGKADIHVHSRYSNFQNFQTFSRSLPFQYPDSVADPAQIVRTAQKKGLSVVCITDHNCIKGGIVAKNYAQSSGAGVDVVVGEEVSTADGEILGLFLTQCVPRGLRAERTIELIHDQGGLAVAAHPYSAFCDCVRDRVLDLPLDGVEVFNASHKDGYANALAMQKTAGLDVARCGGSDAHHYNIIGTAHTLFEGTDAEAFRQALEAGKTRPGGTQITIFQMIAWSEVVALTAMKMLVKSYSRRYKAENRHYPYDPADPLQTRVNMMQEKNRMLSLIGSALYAATPLQLMSGIVGDTQHSKKSQELCIKHGLETAMVTSCAHYSEECSKKCSREGH